MLLLLPWMIIKIPFNLLVLIVWLDERAKDMYEEMKYEAFIDKSK